MLSSIARMHNTKRQKVPSTKYVVRGSLVHFSHKQDDFLLVFEDQLFAIAFPPFLSQNKHKNILFKIKFPNTLFRQFGPETSMKAFLCLNYKIYFSISDGAWLCMLVLSSGSCVLCLYRLVTRLLRAVNCKFLLPNNDNW